MKSAHSQGGYTLLEITVAFAILVVSLGAIFESFSLSETRAVKTANLVTATGIADSVRARIGTELNPSQAAQGDPEGDCSWTVETHPIPRTGLTRATTLVAYRIRIDAVCGRGLDAAHADLSTVELGPP